MMNSKILKSAIQISLLHLVILLLYTNCTQPRQKADDFGIPTIDIIGNISKAQKVNLSTIASSIEYCIWKVIPVFSRSLVVISSRMAAFEFIPIVHLFVMFIVNERAKIVNILK